MSEKKANLKVRFFVLPRIMLLRTIQSYFTQVFSKKHAFRSLHKRRTHKVEEMISFELKSFTFQTKNYHTVKTGGKLADKLQCSKLHFLCCNKTK